MQKSLINLDMNFLTSIRKIHIIFVGIILLLFAFNPNGRDFINFAKVEFLKSNEDYIKSNPIGKVFISSMVNNFLEEYTERNSYGLFSIYKVDLSVINAFRDTNLPDRFLGVGNIFLPINTSMFNIKLRTSSVTCSDVAGPNHHSYMDRIAKTIKMKEWNRYTESYIYALCNNQEDNANYYVLNGSISMDDAVSIGKELGINYSPPTRSSNDYLYEMANEKLQSFLCNACASNAARYFVENPNSELGKVIKKAIDGDASAISEINSKF